MLRAMLGLILAAAVAAWTIYQAPLSATKLSTRVTITEPWF